MRPPPHPPPPTHTHIHCSHRPARFCAFHYHCSFSEDGGITGSGHTAQLFPGKTHPFRHHHLQPGPLLSHFPGTYGASHRASHSFLALSNPTPAFQKLLPLNLCVQTFALSARPRPLITHTHLLESPQRMGGYLDPHTQKEP